MPKETYAEVAWQTNDIHEHRKELELNPWTEEEANDWLLEHEDTIQGLMITRGWDYIYDTIKRMEHKTNA